MIKQLPSVKKRYINERTSAQFIEAIATSTTMNAESVDGLLDHFNSKILNVRDAVALVKIKNTLTKQKTL